MADWLVCIETVAGFFQHIELKVAIKCTVVEWQHSSYFVE